MYSGRLETFHHIADNTLLLNSTSTGSSTCTGSVWGDIAMGLVGTAGTIGMTYAASRASGGGGATAPTATLAGLVSESTTACTNYDLAKGQYDTCKNELIDLQARKNNVDHFDSLDDPAQNLNNDSYKTYEQLQTFLPQIDGAITQINAQRASYAVQDAMINTNGLSETGRSILGSFDKNATSAMCVRTIQSGSSRYPQPSAENQTTQNQTYQNDLQIAQRIDSAITQRQTIKNGILQTYRNLNVPDGSNVTKPTVEGNSSIDDIINALTQFKTNVQNESNQLATQQISSCSNNTIADVYSGHVKFTQAQSDNGLTGDQALGQQIQRKKTELNTKKTAVTALETTLTTAKSKLEVALTQINNLEAESSQYEQSKTDLDAAKARNKQNRNWWQRLWGRGKTKENKMALRDAKATRKKEQGEYETARAQFTGSYADANVGMKNTISRQIEAIQQRLDEITALKAET